MKKAIVTGATGFIGRHMVWELIEKGVSVIAVVRQQADFGAMKALPLQVVICDMEDYRSLSEKIETRDIDCLFHFAWQGVSNFEAKDAKIQLKNVSATLDLVEVAKSMHIKTFVGAGSYHEEEALIELKGGKISTNLGLMYKTAKLAAHLMCKAKAGNCGMRFFWPLINTYGENEKSDRLINSVIRQIFLQQSPELSVGDQYYDFVHVSDVAKALYLIAEKGVDGANYVITSGEAQPLNKFLSKVGVIANDLHGSGNIPLGFGKRKEPAIALPEEFFAFEKLHRDTGFVPVVSFEEGVRRTALAMLAEMFNGKSKREGVGVNAWE